MYNLAQIRRVGWIYITGGMLVLVAGVAAQAAVGLQFEKILVNNLIYYCLFAAGWFLFNQIVMGGTYNKLANPDNLKKLVRLDALPQGEPVSLLGQNYQRVEIGFMLVWLISVVLLQVVLGQNLTLPLGGFAGGWLVGGGLGRLRFVGKVKQEEEEQRRRFFFSDSSLGPRSDVAFFSERTDEPQPVGIPAASVNEMTTSSSLPPGVKRRAVASAPKDPGSQNLRPK
ncbi:MAG TPA: hypothetical protein VH186_29385 [Chloroflexia bacterium]|nr:hypothetical protein [Chloroflexia bacterium]